MSAQIATANGMNQPEDPFSYTRDVIKGKQDPIWWVENILKVRLFPEQANIMREFYRSRYDPIVDDDGNVVNQYKELVLLAGMRGGKTALASVMACYEFWDAITMPDPASYYKLLPNQMLFVLILAASSKQAEDGVYANVAGMIDGCDWIHKYFKVDIRGDFITCEQKRIKLQVLGSWANTAVGRTSKCVIFDELASFEQTAGKRGAWSVYSRVRKSTDTLKYDGHVIDISSAQYLGDIIMELYKKGTKTKNRYESKGLFSPVLPILRETWNMNPNFSEEQLREEYADDLATFNRDYACRPEYGGGMEFPHGVVLTPMVNKMTQAFERSLGYHTDQFRVLAIDPAVTNDSFGIGCGYYDYNANSIIVDGVGRFVKKDGDVMIKPSDVWNTINYLIPKLNINVLLYDTWMYPDVIEKCDTEYGIEFIKHIVNKSDYDLWKGLQERKNDDCSLSVVYDAILKQEAEELQIKPGPNPKVDHLSTGSKDSADCVANIIYYLFKTEVYDPDKEKENDKEDDYGSAMAFGGV